MDIISFVLSDECVQSREGDKQVYFSARKGTVKLQIRAHCSALTECLRHRTSELISAVVESTVVRRLGFRTKQSSRSIELKQRKEQPEPDRFPQKHQSNSKLCIVSHALP